VSRLWIAPVILGAFAAASYYMLVSPPSVYYSTRSPYYTVLTLVFAGLTAAAILAVKLWESANETP